MSYVDEIIDKVIAQNPGQPEFHQTVKEVLDSLRPIVDANEEKYRREALLERMTMPERVIMFRVPWVDDKGQAHVNMGYRVQFNGAIGPYKGGMRCSPEPDPCHPPRVPGRGCSARGWSAAPAGHPCGTSLRLLQSQHAETPELR